MSMDLDRRVASLTAALEQANSTLRGKMDELSLVRRVGDAISHHASIWSLSLELVDAIAETTNCKYAAIYEASGTDGGPFELQAVSSIFPGPEEFPVSLRQTRIVRHLEQSNSPIHISDIANRCDLVGKLAASQNAAVMALRPLTDTKPATRNALPLRRQSLRHSMNGHCEH